MSNWPAAIAAAATLIAALGGVALGAYLNGRSESRQSMRRRRWDVVDRQKANSREVYVRFLNVADRAVDIAWETARIRSDEEQPSWEQKQAAWIEARDEVNRVLTEVRLLAPEPLHQRAVDVSHHIRDFGKDALRYERDDPYTLKNRQKAYQRMLVELIEAMRADLDDWESPPRRGSAPPSNDDADIPG